MMMRMGMIQVTLLVVALVDFGLASPPSTFPAFLWSPHLQSDNGEMDVNYQVMSAKDLVDSVFTRGGWSSFLCSEEKLQQPVDVALVFIGRELLSSDVSLHRNSDPALVNTLKNLYTASNFSLAFPYIAAPEEERMENLLLSGLKEACTHNVGVSNIVFSDSCFVEDGTATGNATVNATTTCDELCKFKSSLLEGILVGIVFLLILISGLCCMAGIDTPTRFETPQDS
ncbi:PREDICTED: uncharacterized protein LOC104778426 [Camelina sativa]|uniref:Uncharacterized protein LOC104778426 n=1 Tax=Camelina sativa TaxID=90675 RepID=A0ABM0YI15_CAMSA|nr:PREDICTED: uncharacterized protein LOC104778426 [Camelina sativa]